MQVLFWGTRGSLPVSLDAGQLRQRLLSVLEVAARLPAGQLDTAIGRAEFVDALPFALRGTYGGQSACVEIRGNGPEHLICDLGSGARGLGNAKLARFGPGTPQTYHIFMSHLHWDHLMGLPFFTPLYIPGNRLIIHGCHAELEAAVRLQMSEPGFPVDFSLVDRQVEFHPMEPGQTYDIAGFQVCAMRQMHGGDSYGYRFAQEGKSFVYATDSEHKLDQEEQWAACVDFFREADLIAFDAMYSLAEMVSVKADWGHSSHMIGVELALAARARRLALFHHDPLNDDASLDRLLADSRRFEALSRHRRPPLEVLSAYDGLIVQL